MLTTTETLLEKLAAEPLAISAEDRCHARYEAALRRMFADATIQSSTKIAFRRVVQLGEKSHGQCPQV